MRDKKIRTGSTTRQMMFLLVHRMPPTKIMPKKDLIQQYWSLDEIMLTKESLVMKMDKLFNNKKRRIDGRTQEI